MSVMNVSEVMDKSIDVLKKNIKTIVVFSLGYGLIALGVTIVLLIIGGISIVFIPKDTSTSMTVVFSILFALAGIFIFSFYIASNAGLVRISGQEILKEQVAAHDAIKTSLKSIPKLFCIVFLGILMFLPIAGIFAAIIYFLIKNIKDSMLLFDIYGAREIMLIIFIVLIAIAAVFCITAFLTWFCFVIQALIVEKTGIIGSIKKSFILVRNNFWSIFWCLILFNITIFALKVSIDSFLAILTTIFYFLEKFLNINQDFITYVSTIFTMLRWPLSILYTLIITPIGTIMISTLYFNQRFKKEGYDLQLRLMEIKQNQEKEQQLSEGV